MSPYMTTLISCSFTSEYYVCCVIVVIKHPFWGIQNLYVAPQMLTDSGNKGSHILFAFACYPSLGHEGLGRPWLSTLLRHPQPESILVPLF